MLILRLWKKQPGAFFCISTKSASGKWHDEFFARADLRDVADYIERNKDKDVYFCPLGFSKPRRLEAYAEMPSMCWADLDEADPTDMKIKPTIAIESSPGRYVGLWILRDTLDRKETNQQLSYAVGADKGGWDLTQVLRVPGTTNYKYQSTPRVRTLWIDGPQYSLAGLKKLLPHEVEEDTTDAQAVYKRYERKMPPWLRREILNGKPTQGKRSEMVWKLNNALLEMGVSTEETFVLLKASPWNKFKGRDDQLRREIEKSSGKKLNGHNHAYMNGHDYRFLQRSLQEVEEEEIDWIWYPYLARGELSILEGDPGVGKSYLAQVVCAHLADKRRLPSVKHLPPVQGKVAYFDIENSAGTVTKKRLSSICTNLENFFQEEEPFSIDDDDKLDEVFEAIEQLKPTIVVFDTINTYIGKADIHKSSETQQAFAIFREIAKRFNCAVLVLRHLTKGKSDQKALYRGQGSIAFAGLARVVMTVGVMPDDEDTRVMAVTKINVTKPPKGLTFSIIALPDTLKEKDRSKFEWGEFVDITSDEIVSAPPAKSGRERDEAKEWLVEQLSRSPMSAQRLQAAAESKSISWRTIERAAQELGVTRKSTGFGKSKSSVWTLAEKKARPVKSAPEEKRIR